MRKNIIKIIIAIIVIAIVYPGSFYVYWMWRGMLGDPFSLIKEEGQMKVLSNEALIGKMNSIDPFSPYPKMAMSILGERKADEAVPSLIQKLNSWDRYSREASIRALGNIGDKEAIPGLMKIINRKQRKDYEYLLALEALAKLKSEEAYSYAIDLAKENNPASINILKQYAKPESIELIANMRTVFTSDSLSDRIYRKDIDEAIAHIKKANNIQ